MQLAVSLHLEPGALAVAAGVLAVAAFVRGYSGFGFSAVLVAGLAFVVEPIEAVPLAIGFEVLASVVQGRSVWSEVRWSDVRTLLLAAVVGNPIGVVVLVTVEAEPLRVITFVVLLVLCAALLTGRTARVAPTGPLVFCIGVVAGVVNGATAMSGLVLVLAMTYVAIAAAEIRATLVVYFFASDLLVLALLAFSGDLTGVWATRLVLGIPVLVVGIALGTRAFRRASEAAFRTVTLTLLATISLVGLGRIAF